MANPRCAIINDEPDIPVYLSSKSCQIRIKSHKPFDFENQKSYLFFIKAFSGSNLLPSTEIKKVFVTVKVIDVNDERPVFAPFWTDYPDSIAKAVLIGETKTPPGTRVFQVQATDADAKAHLEFRWSPGLDSSVAKRFSISPNSGVITTVGDDPFLTNHVYRLSIRVVDLRADVPETSFADMLLLVYTAFQPVQFPLPVFQINISEEIAPETVVGYIPARSLNGLNQQVTFNVLRRPDPAKEPVRIDNGGDGKITIKHHVDYESVLDHSWSYLIEGHVSNAYSATALMVVNIVDLDDNPPYFELAAYQTELILETVHIGTVVLEVTPGDKDTDQANRVYKYELKGLDAANFRVAATSTGSAQIITSELLNFDMLPTGRPFYEFGLVASDRTSSAGTVIRVMIQNANVNPPVILPLPPFRIYRQRNTNSHPFAQVSATDRDGGIINFFFVDIVTNRPIAEVGPFKIEGQTGKIFLSREPDLTNYTLPVRATDLGSCPGCPAQGSTLESETVSISVEVVDLNLVAPTFTECPTNMTILELAAVGTVIGKVTATDVDDPDLAAIRIRYELVGNTVFAKPSLYLTIDSKTGSITNTKALLRNADQFGGVLPDQLFFTIAAYDWGVPKLKSFCNFRLEIEDINNYPPQFDPESYTAFVQRYHDFSQYPSSAILHVVAVDLDQQGTQNAEIVYEFNPPDLILFAIDKATGEIKVTGTLLDEKYTFDVTARNPVPLAGTTKTWQFATVTIVATSDLNLLPPVLRFDFSAENFMENSSNMALVQASASPWPGASYEYSITHVPGDFEQTGWVNSPPPFTTEIIYSPDNRPTLTLYSGSNFLYQRLNKYTIRIRACQQPTHPIWGDICSDAVKIFHLEDVNNMVPQFIDQSSLSEVELPENVPAGTTVLKLFAADMDPTPAFSQVKYSLMQTTDAINFVIIGDLLKTSTTPLDYEKKKNYVLKVKAEDSAPSSFAANHGRPNSGELPLTIHLLDQNDNCPRISSTPIEFNVAEAVEVGAEIGQIMATDADATSILTYTLTGKEYEFAINSATGMIIVARPLGLATVQNQQYTVSVNDGACETSSLITINILPSNDRLPVFSQSLYNYTVIELSTRPLDPSPSAMDPNTPKNLTFSLGGYRMGYFSINSETGELRIIKGIPRDHPEGQPICRISVIADNQKGLSYSQVQVNLIDINNQYPRWPFPNQMVACPENSPVGIECGVLSAPDADFELNAVFDFEAEMEKTHYIPIIATNIRPPATGGRAYSVSGTLTVVITDDNDWAPTIVGGPDFSITVPETASVGVDIFEIYIQDNDVMDFGKHSCILSSVNAYFGVVYNPNIDACGIRPLQKLNVDDHPSVPPGPQNLTVIIFDSSHINRVISTVHIEVTEANDNSPIIHVQPSTGPGEVLDQTMGVLSLVSLQAPAVDAADEGFWFHIDSKSSANGIFGIEAITENTARLQLISRLERDTLLELLKNPDTSPVPSPILPSNQDGKVRWPIILSVNDKLMPSLTSTATLTLTVITKGPVIPANELTGYLVPDNSAPGTPILPQFIQAIDLDYPSALTDIAYDISSNSAQALRLFEIINSTAGKFSLALRTTISREVEGVSCFSVPIIASIPSLTRTATSTLTVTVTTDNPPAPGNGQGRVEVFIPSDTWQWPYANALPNIPIAAMPVTEVYSCDRVNRVFKFIPQNENALMFKVTDGGILYLITASPPGDFSVEAAVSTRFDQTLPNATSSLNIRINWIPGSGFTNGIIIRIQKATMEWFVERSAFSGLTPRERFTSAIAERLGINKNTIAVFPVEQIGEDFNVFVGVHSSPYEVPGRIIDTIYHNADDYTTVLRTNTTNTQVGLAAVVRGLSGAVELQCGSEEAANSVCESRGCRTRLTTIATPTDTAPFAGLTKPSPGISTSGSIIRTLSDCWCNGGDPVPPTKQPIDCSSPDACLNGGFCSIMPGTQTTYCECPVGFSGRRCEQTQVYFTDEGYAWTPSIGGCAQLHIQLQLMISDLNDRPGLIMYAGPISQLSTNVVYPDFIGLQLESEGRRLTLAYSLGRSGIISATYMVNFRLDDGGWHKIDIVLRQKLASTEVTLMVDACGKSNGVAQTNGLEYPPSLVDCLFTLSHNRGVDRALNVDQWPLQLGGRKVSNISSLYPSVLTTHSLPAGSAFRHVLVNGELWNLAQWELSENAVPAPPVCLSKKGQDICAPNSVCWVESGRAVCKCRQGYQEEKGNCIETKYSVELGPRPSYLELTLKSQLIDQVQTDVTFDFRTRSANGTLIYLGGPEPNYFINSSMDIRLFNTRLEVSMNLGDFNTLLVSPARSQLNDGAWHHVRVFRSLSSLFVELDDGAGPGLAAFLPLDVTSNYLKMSIGKKILIGARRDLVPDTPALSDGEVRPADSSIGETCFRDLRIGGNWYPLSSAEISAAGENSQVISISSFGTNLDACSDLTACPTNASCAGDLTCVPTWKPPGGYMCLCRSGCVEGPGSSCHCLAICSRFPCQNGGTCQPSVVDSRGFVCHCPATHFGLYCEEEVMRANLSVGAFVGIVLAIVCFIGLIIGVIIWRCRRKKAPPQISPDKDLREYVMPYAEKADEIDTHSFDERKLRMPEPPPPLFPTKTRSLTETPGRTQTTASPIYTATDVTSLGRVLKDQLKTSKTSEVPDYTLDYGYEGGDTSADEEGEGISSPLHEETSSGFNEGGVEPFGDAFDALDQISDRDDFSGTQR